MPFISDAQLARVQNTMASNQSRTDRARKKAKEKATEMTYMLEMVGGAGAMGFVRGKMEEPDGSWNIPGTTIDIEMVAGLGLVGAALFDLFGKWDDDALMVGGGVLAHYTGQVFRKFGKTGDFALVAGHNYPSAAHGGAASIGTSAESLLGVGAGMDEALRSALSASGV